MKAAIIKRFGATEDFQVIEIPFSFRSDQGVIVKVRAASVNPVDWKIKKNGFRNNNLISFPLILGIDFAGEITEIDEQFKNFKVGDKVYGHVDMSRMGCYAEFTKVQIDEIALMPDGISFVEAASLPVVGITALMALRDLAEIKKNDRILILGAAGGIGSFACQYAKSVGALVSGTASLYNFKLLKDLGVDELIDYNQTDLGNLTRQYDIVLDTVGGNTLLGSYSVVRKGGILISVVQKPPQANIEVNEFKTGFVYSLPSQNHLLSINKLIENNSVKPVIMKVFPLEEINLAHRISEKGHLSGKLVIEM